LRPPMFWLFLSSVSPGWLLSQLHPTASPALIPVAHNIKLEKNTTKHDIYTITCFYTVTLSGMCDNTIDPDKLGGLWLYKPMTFLVLQWSLINLDNINPDASSSVQFYMKTKYTKIYHIWSNYLDASFIWTIFLGTKISGLTRLNCIIFSCKTLESDWQRNIWKNVIFSSEDRKPCPPGW
jgi:hypothetical protein